MRAARADQRQGRLSPRERPLCDDGAPARTTARQSGNTHDVCERKNRWHLPAWTAALSIEHGPPPRQEKCGGLFRPAPMAWRVTHICRKEDGVWKLVSRHADPLMGKAAPVTVLQRERRHANVGVHPALAAVMAQNSPTRGPLTPPNALTMWMAVGHDGSERPL
jgi:hypothetical protein